MDFHVFKHAIARQFAAMAKQDLFRTGVERDELWDHYLNSFPEGSNPIYRERTEHDCSCCRQFVKDVGNAVAVSDDGKLISIWDCTQLSEPAYKTVAASMSALVKSKPIVDVFLHYQRHAGTDKSFEKLTDGVREWKHFYAELPLRNQGRKIVCEAADIPSKLGEARSLRDVFLRGLREINPEAVSEVLDLISSNSLYRGEEYKANVVAFQKLQKKFSKAPNQGNFAWANYDQVGPAIAGIKNTAIGTLLMELSEGMDLEKAVARFEAMVAPQNYKRTTALVSKAMVEKARQKIVELGLEPSLHRRFATLADVSVNDIIFADRSAKTVMRDAFDLVDTKASPRATKKLDKLEEITIEKFISDVVPRVDSIEILVENRHMNNLVSLIAPIDPRAKPLFKWQNPFSWAYKGDVTDSIKERVKRAGGNVTGDLCCRLAWYNNDDLDFHMYEPNRKVGNRMATGDHIWFRTKRVRSTAGGMLDVDMNGSDGMHRNRTPVENIFYARRSTMTEGVYELVVEQYQQRETKDPGFEVEMDYLGEVTRFAYPKIVKGRVRVAKFEHTHTSGIKIIDSLPSSSSSKETWGIKTQDYRRVSTVMLSPNYWEGKAVGNKHYFFMIDGCRADEPARGFFNEFLSDELKEHRKVLEMVGAKMTVADSPEQLAGLGFSSTQHTDVIVRVKGALTRELKVVF